MREEWLGIVPDSPEDGQTGSPPPPEPLWRRDDGKKRTLRRIALVLILLAILFAGVGVAGRILPSQAPENPDAYDPVTLEPRAPEGIIQKIGQFVFAKDVTLAGERGDRINVLLLGIGGEGHEGANLSDTIMIASIKPSTKQVAMVSIPRDLLVDIPGRGQQKINHANAFGEAGKEHWGAALATEVVEDTFNIDIHYYVRVDFRAFADIVNAVEGIKVNVDRSFQDPLYPAPNFAYKTVSFARGVQTMDGDTALIFARSRHGSNGEGSDFARSRRQQKVLLALKEKILSAGTILNPIRIKEILDALDAHITTNMTFPEMLAFIKLGRTLNTGTIATLVLDTSEKGYLKPGVGPEGAFVLVPVNGSWSGITDAVKDIFDSGLAKTNDTPHQDAPQATAAAGAATSIEVQNGTWRAGLAARMKKRLTDASFAVETIGNTTDRPQSRSGIYALSKKTPQALLEALRNELRISIASSVPAGVITASTTDILILLGEDWVE